MIYFSLSLSFFSWGCPGEEWGHYSYFMAGGYLNVKIFLSLNNMVPTKSIKKTVAFSNPSPTGQNLVSGIQESRG